MPHFSGRISTCLGLAIVAALAAVRVADAEIRVEAIVGQPLGVGSIEVDLPETLHPEALGLEGLGVTEAKGRVLYPAVESARFGPILKDVTGILNRSERPIGRLLGELLDRPLQTTAKAKLYFLFQGADPLELTLQSRRLDTLEVMPVVDPGRFGVLFELWWRSYSDPPGFLDELVRKPHYPPQVDSYLKAMLAHRLELTQPEPTGGESFDDRFARELGLVTGTELIRVAFCRDRFEGRSQLNEPAELPLPEPVDIPALELPEVDLGEVEVREVSVPKVEAPDATKEEAEEEEREEQGNEEVEPIAMRVPAECLYVRYGNFANFLWFEDLFATWGGDLRNLAAQRGLDYEVQRRVEESLVQKQTPLARLFGGSAVADVALVGTDLLFQEGGSYGLLFHARRGFLLGRDFQNQRAERLERGDGAVEETITIDGHDVSYLHSPDGTARSYYAADGPFHFVTRSETLMRRFLETGSGQRALGTSKEFVSIRGQMPLDRDDTVFVYLSDAFFRNFTGPRSRIEMVRRMQALADIEMVQLALLAAAAEGWPGEGLDDLIAGGFLPPTFGVRPDGSQTVFENGRVHDSLRGYRGAFVPLADVEVGRVSEAEAHAYEQFAKYYRANWERLDPIAVGIRRESLPGNREQIFIDARMTPFTKANYRRLRTRLGPPDTLGLARIAGDGFAAEAVLTDQRVFGALRDIRPPSLGFRNGSVPFSPRENRGRRPLGFRPIQGIFQDILVGYFGTTGDLDPLELFNPRIHTPPNALGLAARPRDLWRREINGLTVYSLQPDLVAEVAPKLQFVETERPAQIRVHVADVSGATITPALNNLGYAQTRSTSLGNLHLMHDLAQQLHVPGAHCREAAELLLDAKLLCPLRGDYEFREVAEGRGFWTSTELSARPAGGLLTTQAPTGFVAPPLNWFRGLEASVTVTPEVLSAHAELIMQMPEETP